MSGTKARALHRWADANGRDFVRFDYRGHGESGGAWEECTIGMWRDDALAILDRVTTGPQVLVGSSMGGWIALLTALARPERVAGLLLVAAAPDFTARLIEPNLSDAQRDALSRDGKFIQPSAYDPAGYSITARLLEEGREHLLLERPIPLACPVRLLHGQRDADVPWTLSLDLARALAGEDVRLTLVKDGDHRLSRERDLGLMLGELARLAA